MSFALVIGKFSKGFGINTLRKTVMAKEKRLKLKFKTSLKNQAIVIIAQVIFG